MNTVFGTLLYMAQERAEVSADFDTRVDIHALGAILYELLTGSTRIDVANLTTDARGHARSVNGVDIGTFDFQVPTNVAGIAGWARRSPRATPV